VKRLGHIGVRSGGSANNDEPVTRVFTGDAVVLRRRSDDDVDACLELAEHTHQHDGYPPWWPWDRRAFIVAPAEEASWVADDQGRVMGHVAIHNADGDPAFRRAHELTGLGPGHVAVVARLMVSPSARRVGVGRRLLDEAVAFAHQSGRRPILDTIPSNTKAIALYRTKGWTEAGTETLTSASGRRLDVVVFVGPAPR